MTGNATLPKLTLGKIQAEAPAENPQTPTDSCNPSATTSIAKALRRGRTLLDGSSDSAALDAEVLLCFVLDKQRAYLRTWPERLLQPEQQRRYQKLLQQRRAGHPVAYLTGSREFWSREFIVTPDVLIPRPETELLIERALGLLPQGQKLQVLDLGTGSGAIAVTLAAERPQWRVTATDISAAALSIARSNARHHAAANIRFHRSRWFDDLPDARYDLIVSNPPYIAPDDEHLQQGDLRFEPQTALAADRNGIADIEEIINKARRQLHPGGRLLLEHGCDQQRAVQTLLQRCRYSEIHTHTDLAGLPRVSLARWPGISC